MKKKFFSLAERIKFYEERKAHAESRLMALYAERSAQKLELILKNTGEVIEIKPKAKNRINLDPKFKRKRA